MMVFGKDQDIRGNKFRLGKPGPKKGELILYKFICKNKNCLKEFESRDQRRVYCSKSCWAEDTSTGRKRLDITGENNWNWNGGITSLNDQLRKQSLYKIWRQLVFIRDKFICQNTNCEFCHNLQGVYLHPHHKKPVALFPELAFKVENGITYCKGYHLSSGLHKGIIQEKRRCADSI